MMTGIPQKSAYLYGLLDLLAEDTPCRLDHHGYCQEHYWFSEEPCPHREAHELLQEVGVRERP